MLYKKGFTLIELLVTMAIAGIVLAIGFPSFSRSIEKSRKVTSANELVAVINLARNEAVKRGAQVTVLRLGASPGVWEAGWDVFVDYNGNATFDDDGDSTPCEAQEDCLLKTYSALPGDLTLRNGDSSFNDSIAYLPTGLITITTGDVFKLCDSSAETSRARAISINSIGRPRVSKGTASCP